MARYKVQGPNGEIIEIEGPDGANPADVIAQAQTLYQPKPEQSTWDKFTEPFKDVSVKDWAEKSFLAPALQTMQSVTPFGLLRPDMAAMNLKQGSQNLVGKGQQLAQGAYNVATNPVESAQKAYTAVTENPAGVAGSLAKGILYDPEMLIGSGLGNLAEKGIKSTVSGVGKAAAVPIDFGRGAFRGMAYPGGTAPNTSLVPIKPNYVPHEQVRQFMAGERPATSLTTAPTSELINQTTGGRWAYGMAPKNAAGERLVPAQGRLMEGIGENIGGGIRTNPLQGLVDIGGIIGGVGPVGSMIKAVPAAATTRLSQATNFEPGFVAARNAALAREGRAGLQGSLPQTPLLSGPVRPGGEYTPTVYVGPTGEATTNVAGTQTNYRPAPARSSTFNEVRGGGFGQASRTPAELAREAAAARIAPPKTAEQQAILDSIRARAQASGAKYTPPRVDTPTVAPVAPAEMPPAAVVAPAAATSTLDQLRSRLTPQTPEQIAAVEAYNALSPAEKARQTRAENAAKKAPPGVIEMIPGKSGSTSLANQFKENYRYIGDNEKMPDGSKHYGNAHYHGSRTSPLTPEEVRGRRMTNEIKDKGSEQTYWVKQGDTVKHIYSDGPDLTITVYDAKTGKQFEYKRGKSYDGKTEYSTVTYDKNGSEINRTPRKDKADLTQWPEEFRQSHF